MGHHLRLQEDAPANRVMKQYFRRIITNVEPARKTSRRERVLTTIPRLLQLDLQSLSTTTRLNLFTVTELSTGTDLVKLRLRAQNQLLWRKGVDAIIEVQSSSSPTRRRTPRTPRTPRSRTPDRTKTSARTTKHITVS